MRWPAGRRRRRDDRGAVAVITAFAMLALLVVGGLVLNVGAARTDKITNKSYTDAAVAAGVRSLDLGDGKSHPFNGACTALAYLKANDPQLAGMTSAAGQWRDGAGGAIPAGAVSGDPCDPDSTLLGATCVDASKPTWASYHWTNGPVTVDIKNGYETPDAPFDAVGSADNSVTGGCDQLAVIIHERQKPGLAGAGRNDIVTSVRSVSRLTASSPGNAAAALLILERTNCTAISVNSTNTFIEVKGFGTTPGVIHSDSNGSGPACLPTNPAILGKFAGPPGVSARQSETDNPALVPPSRLAGLITTVAGSGSGGSIPGNATDGARKVCAELATPPTTSSTSPATACGAAGGRPTVGRAPVDKRYNTSPSTGVSGAMAAGATLYNSLVTPVGYTVLPGGCSNIAGSTLLVKVFVNCPLGATFKDFAFTNATHVVFNGDVKLGSPATQTLSMPNVTRLYVKGSTATNGGVQVAGMLKVNTGASADCSTRGAAASAQIVVGTGQFAGNAQSAFHLCQTTVLLANDLPVGAGACPVPPTPPLGSTGLAPYNNTCNGYIDVNAGGDMDWTAPNHLPVTATASEKQTAWDNLEDLALWTEASHGSSVGGGASMTLTGVFFLPNADPFTISGHGNQTIPANAQFIARKLSVQGQGTLYMRPDPSDSFVLPIYVATFTLAR